MYQYKSPIESRYLSKSMATVFSDFSKYSTWRMLWTNLAKAQKEQGIKITDMQIQEMVDNTFNIDFDRVKEIESVYHHDVMAHLEEFCEKCPNAKPIIHLGATSSYVTDNTDVLLIRKALGLIEHRLVKLIDNVCSRAVVYKDVPTLSYTHFQPAQPTTVGRRMVMWGQDLLMDLENVHYQLHHMNSLGCRGATGTSDSFVTLFNGDVDKVKKMENFIVSESGLPEPFTISGQTYTRKQDFYIMSAISGIAQSCYKFGVDVRLLSHTGEMTEYFDTNQVGSSAMPYKKNPINSEKICGLSRYVMDSLNSVMHTTSAQWLERSLDDSSTRRIVIPEMFMLIDYVLTMYGKILHTLSIDEDTINKRLAVHEKEMVLERSIINEVKNGGDRQSAHKKFRNGEPPNEGVDKSHLYGVSSKQVTDFIKHWEKVKENYG